MDKRKILPGKPQFTLAERPELLSVFMNEPGWEHLKVLAFMGRLTISEKPIPIAAIPFRHWDAIVSVACRLDPSIHVTLDAPNAFGATKAAKTKRESQLSRTRDIRVIANATSRDTRR